MEVGRGKTLDGGGGTAHNHSRPCGPCVDALFKGIANECRRGSGGSSGGGEEAGHQGIWGGRVRAPEEFLGLVQRQQAPLVVYAAVSRWFSGPSHQYLTSYKGLAFYAESPTPLTLPSGCEIVEAASIWVPG